MSFFEADKSSKNPAAPTPTDFPALRGASTDAKSPAPLNNNTQRSFSSVVGKNFSSSRTFTPSKSSKPDIQKRKVPVRPGYDFEAHKECLCNYKPSFNMGSASSSQVFSQPSQTSLEDLSPPKKLVTSAEIHHSANSPFTPLSLKVTHANQGRTEGESMEEDGCVLSSSDF